MERQTPEEQCLVDELLRVRDEGLRRLRRVELPALLAAARLVSRDEVSPSHIVVEALLRRAVERLGGGAYGDAAVALLGLDAGTRGLNSKLRRELAAEAFNRTYETFRKNYELEVFAQLATQILVLVSEQRSRQARRDLERSRSLPETAMPEIWLERFGAYYRVWTPLSGLANDLSAYRMTLLEPDRPWDRRFGADGPTDAGYSQEEQAEGYALFALYHYARFEWELRQFITLFGGQWLLSDADAEQAVADAVYRISMHSPCNERDQSLLRMLVAGAPDQELHAFISSLLSSEIGRATYGEWQEWVDRCDCADDDARATTCSVHEVIRACAEYMRTIDEDWQRLADWYHVPAEQRTH